MYLHFGLFYSSYVALTLVSYVLKVDKEEKVASLRVPAIGVVSELKLGALNVMGTHNYYNAAVAALSVLGLDMGIDTEAISSTIEKLRVPPHRMQIGKWKWMVILFVILYHLLFLLRDPYRTMCLMVSVV